MNRAGIYISVILILLAVGCKKVTILDETSEKVELYDYFVDEFGNEGIVFYSYYSDHSDLAIVISAEEAELPWGPMGELVFVADTIKQSYLYDNTFSLSILQEMFYKGIERYPAQNWCNDMNHGRIPYSGSWRLPSKNEWEKVCSRIKGINAALSDIGAAPLSEDSFFWTATEDFPIAWESDDGDDDPANRALPLSINKTAYKNKDLWIKEMKYHVRAIKYILYAD